MDEIVLNSQQTQPFLIVQHQNFQDPFISLIIDKKVIPIGYVNFQRGFELLLKAFYVFNLKYVKEMINVFNFFECFVLRIKNCQAKSSVATLFNYINTKN